jgi:hypothetical protein
LFAASTAAVAEGVVRWGHCEVEVQTDINLDTLAMMEGDAGDAPQMYMELEVLSTQLQGSQAALLAAEKQLATMQVRREGHRKLQA